MASLYHKGKRGVKDFPGLSLELHFMLRYNGRVKEKEHLAFLEAGPKQVPCEKKRV